MQTFRTRAASSLLSIAALEGNYQSKYAAKRHISQVTEEDIFFEPISKLPAKIDRIATFALFSSIKDEIILHYKNLLEAQGWRFYVVKQLRGRCYYLDRRITIPYWATQSKKPGYLDWYISHEMAHAMAGHKTSHGAYFMAWLRAICPVESIHYEVNYKPKNATLNGISKNQSENILKEIIETLPDSEFL